MTFIVDTHTTYPCSLLIFVDNYYNTTTILFKNILYIIPNWLIDYIMTNYVLDAGLCRGRCQPGAGGSQWPGSPVWPEFVQDVIMIDGRCDNWCSNYNYQQLPGWCPLSVWSQCIWWGQSGAAIKYIMTPPPPARQVSRCETRPPLLDSSVADWWLRCEHLQWQQQQCDDNC